MVLRIKSGERANQSVQRLQRGLAKQKQSPAEYRLYLQMAAGSADEMRVLIRYCLDLGSIDEVKWTEWREEYTSIAKMLQGLYQSWKDK